MLDTSSDALTNAGLHISQMLHVRVASETLMIQPFSWPK